MECGGKRSATPLWNRWRETGVQKNSGALFVTLKKQRWKVRLNPGRAVHRRCSVTPGLDSGVGASLCHRTPQKVVAQPMECGGKRSATPLWNRWRGTGVQKNSCALFVTLKNGVGRST